MPALYRKETLKAITLYPVWAWTVVHGHKTIENRTWRTHYRGPLLIHAAADSPRAQASDKTARIALAALGVEVAAEVPCGAIAGAVELIEVFRYNPQDRAWVRMLREGIPNLLFPPAIDPAILDADSLATGPYCWLFARPHCFAMPVRAKGRQGLWTLTGPAARVLNRIVRSLYNND